jgi:hypothetical protein
MKDDIYVDFDQKVSWWEMVYCRDATASTFVAKVRVEILTRATRSRFTAEETSNLTQPFYIKENNKHPHDFVFHESCFLVFG